MASETVFAYVGPKGSGKTHEGTKRAVEAARARRGCVVIIPELDVSKVAELVGIPLAELSTFFRVYDYDAVDLPNFWPDEKRLKLTKSADGSFVPGPEFSPTGWRESIVRAGDLVIIDEGWRWLESSKTIPPKFKTALHMARHWRGPVRWDDPDEAARWLRDPCNSSTCLPCRVHQPNECPVFDGNGIWHPGMGGPRDKGGDGTQLVSTNILILTQDYSALDNRLRKQVDQISDIRSYKDETLPGWLQAIAKKLPFAWAKGMVTDGHYSVSTFDGHRLPERKTKAYQTNRKSFEKLPHLPQIHGLFEKAGGQALEVAVDKRGGLDQDSRYGHIIWLIGVFAVAIPILLFLAGSKLTKMMGHGDAKKVAAPTASTAPPNPGAAAADQNSSKPRIKPLGVARVVGTIGGSAVVVTPSGLVRMGKATELVRTQEGWFGDVEGSHVDAWSAPVGGRVGRDSLGVDGPGASIAGAVAGY